jgi:single-stranded-DNA-specific exonuclease
LTGTTPPSFECNQAFINELKISPIISTLLLQRDIHTYDKAKKFFRPEALHLHSPWLMHGMVPAVERIEKAIHAKEHILIYGDYDVDGTTSVALLSTALATVAPQHSFYIPNRKKEGYSLSIQGIEEASRRGATLLICIDCGTKENMLITEAKKRGIDTIVCDHHEPGTELPPVVALLNPKQKRCSYPYQELSGCGIGFKLLQALAARGIIASELPMQLLDYVAMSIAADIVDITGENRTLAYLGLQKMNENKHFGFAALAKITGRTNNTLNISDLVFGFAPYINAAGRMGHAIEAVSLFLASTEKKANECAEVLSRYNTKRKEIDQQMLSEALEMIQKEELVNRSTHVLHKKGWDKGVVGIVASRCIEHYYKPTIMLCEEEGMLTGSARSVAGYDLYEALSACAKYLHAYGGHAYAAGLTLHPEQLPFFKAAFEQEVKKRMDPPLTIPVQKISFALDLEEITPSLFRIIQQMGPFGPGNRQPVFSSHVIIKHHKIYQQKHLKLYVQSLASRVTWEAIGFGMATKLPHITSNMSCEIAYTIQKNDFMGRSSLQLMLRDVRQIKARRVFNNRSGLTCGKKC